MLRNAIIGVVCQGVYPEVQHHVLVVLTVLRSPSYAGQRNRVFIGGLCWIRCLLTLLCGMTIQLTFHPSRPNPKVRGP